MNNGDKNFNGICWMCSKAYIWECPLLKHFPKHIISCTAFEPTAQCRMIREFIKKIDKCLKDRYDPIGTLIELKEEYERILKGCHIN